MRSTIKIHYTSKTINTNCSKTGRKLSHINFGAMTRIWTPNVIWSQLKSDKLAKTWILNVKRSPLRSVRVIRIRTFSGKGLGKW